MTIEGIKNVLIRNKAIHDQQVATAQQSIKSIEETLKKYTDQDYETLRAYGFPIDQLRNLDLDRMLKDEAYVRDLQKFLEATIDGACKKLESDLNA